MGAEEKPLKIIAVESLPRSGSTLLTMLLSAHPELGTIGERNKFCYKMFGKEKRGSPICTCGVPFRQCEVWTYLADRIREEVPGEIRKLKFVEFQLIPTRLYRPLRRYVNRQIAAGNVDTLWPPPLKQRLHAVMHANEVLMRTLLEKTNTSAFLDSSKTFYQSLAFDTLAHMDVRILYLIRDGRGVVHSRKKRKHFAHLSVSQLTRGWKQSVTKQLEDLQRSGSTHMVVKYEDLCANKEDTLNRVLAFCDLAPFSNWEVPDAKEMHIFGSGLTRMNPTAPIVDKQSWKQDFTKSDLDAFELEGGNFNRSLGYLE